MSSTALGEPCKCLQTVLRIWQVNFVEDFCCTGGILLSFLYRNMAFKHWFRNISSVKFGIMTSLQAYFVSSVYCTSLYACYKVLLCLVIL